MLLNFFIDLSELKDLYSKLQCFTRDGKYHELVIALIALPYAEMLIDSITNFLKLSAW